MIVAVGNRVVMKENLNQALYAALGMAKASIESALSDEAPITEGRAADNLGVSALDQYRKAEVFLRQGNWAEFGKALDELEKTLIKMSARKEGAK